MSTNYYFIIKAEKRNLTNNKELNEYLFNQIDRELHIGMTSAGWVPTFQGTEFYKSVKEIEAFYEKHKENLVIEDEYGWEMSMEELRADLFEWNADNKDALSHLEYPDTYLDEDGYEFTNVIFS